MQRSGIFFTDKLDNIIVILEVFETLAYVLLVQRTKHRIVDIVELLGHENTLVAGKWHWLREVCAVNIVNRTPRTVNPMGTGLEYVMLEIVFMEQHQTLLAALLGKLFKACPIPFIGFGQVIPAKSIPCSALSRTRERLLVKRSPHIAVGPADALMVGSAQVVPQSIIMVKHAITVL